MNGVFVFDVRVWRCVDVDVDVGREFGVVMERFMIQAKKKQEKENSQSMTWSLRESECFRNGRTYRQHSAPVNIHLFVVCS